MCLGDIARAKKDNAAAGAFYRELAEKFPSSAFALQSGGYLLRKSLFDIQSPVRIDRQNHTHAAKLQIQRFKIWKEERLAAGQNRNNPCGRFRSFPEDERFFHPHVCFFTVHADFRIQERRNRGVMKSLLRA